MKLLKKLAQILDNIAEEPEKSSLRIFGRVELGQEPCPRRFYYRGGLHYCLRPIEHERDGHLFEFSDSDSLLPRPCRSCGSILNLEYQEDRRDWLCEACANPKR